MRLFMKQLAPPIDRKPGSTFHSARKVISRNSKPLSLLLVCVIVLSGMTMNNPSAHPPEEREVKDFYFKLLCQLRITKDLKSGSYTQLLSVASTYGLVFVGTDTGVTVLKTTDLEQFASDQHDATNVKEVLDNYPVHSKIATRSPPTHVSINGDQTIVSVATVHNQCAFLLLYDLGALANEAAAEPFLEFPLSSNPGDTLTGLAWNPAVPTLMAYCMSDGKLVFINVKESRLHIVGSAGGKTIKHTCVCWSPKGKQLVAGDCAGSLRQYNQEVKLAKHTVTPLTESKVLDVFWHSTSTFFAAIQSEPTDPEKQPEIYIIHTKKDQPPMLVNFDDVCYGNGADRPPKYYFQHIPIWDIVLTSSANALEIAVFGRNAQVQAQWERWSQEDSGRAEFPLDVDYNNTLPVGIGVDYTANRNIVINEALSVPSMPMLYMLSTEGVLLMYHVVNTQEGAAPLSQPAAPPPSVKYVKQAAPSSGTAPQKETPLSVPQQPSVSAGQFNFGVPAQSSTVIFTRPPVTVATTKPAVFSFNSSASAVKPGLSFASQLPTNQKPPATMQQPVFKLAESKPVFGAVSTPSTVPAMSGHATPAVAQQPLIKPPETKPVMVPVSNSDAVPSPSATPASSVVQQQVTKPPVVKPTSTAVAQPSPALSQLTNTGMSGSTKKVPEVKPVLSHSTTNRPKQPSSEANLSVDSEFTKNILEEIDHFNKELEEAKQRTRSCRFKVGDKAELGRLTSGILGLAEFCKEVKETTEDINGDIHQLKSQTLNLFALEEDARVQKQRMSDPRLRHLHRSRPLDPTSSQTLQSVRHLNQYIETSLRDVNAKLDSEWDQYSRGRGRKTRAPISDTLYRSLTNNHNVITSQTYRLNKLMGEMKQLKIHNDTSVWQNSDLSSYVRPCELGDREFLSSLADSLVEPASPMPSKPRATSVSPAKQAKLRQFLSERGVVPVHATPPGELSSSRLLDVSQVYQPACEDISDSDEDLYTANGEGETSQSLAPSIDTDSDSQRKTEVEIKFASGDNALVNQPTGKPVFAMAPPTSSIATSIAGATVGKTTFSVKTPSSSLPVDTSASVAQPASIFPPLSTTQIISPSPAIVASVPSTGTASSSESSILAELLTSESSVATQSGFSFNSPKPVNSSGFQFGKTTAPPTVNDAGKSSVVQDTLASIPKDSEKPSAAKPFTFGLPSNGSTPFLLNKSQSLTGSPAVLGNASLVPTESPQVVNGVVPVSNDSNGVGSSGKLSSGVFSFGQKSSMSASVFGGVSSGKATFNLGQTTPSFGTSLPSSGGIFGQPLASATVTKPSDESRSTSADISNAEVSKPETALDLEENSEDLSDVDVESNQKVDEVKNEPPSSESIDVPSNSETAVSFEKQPPAGSTPLFGQSSSGEKPLFGKPTAEKSVFGGQPTGDVAVESASSDVAPLEKPSSKVKVPLFAPQTGTDTTLSDVVTTTPTPTPSVVFEQPTSESVKTTNAEAGKAPTNISIFRQSTSSHNFQSGGGRSDGGTVVSQVSADDESESTSDQSPTTSSTAAAVADSSLFAPDKSATSATVVTSSQPTFTFGKVSTGGTGLFGQVKLPATTTSSGSAFMFGKSESETTSVFGQQATPTLGNAAVSSGSITIGQTSSAATTTGTGFDFRQSTGLASTVSDHPSDSSLSSTSVFGKFGSGGSGIFGQSSSANTFGQMTTPLFAQATTPTGGMFGQTTSSSTPVFGQTTSAAPPFGQPPASSAPPIFGFSQPAASGTPLFGQSTGSGSIFGQTSTSTPGVFGQSQPTFGSSASSTTGIFGSGISTPSGGSGLFGGLGGKPSAEKASQNPFGINTPITPNSTSNLFGPTQGTFGQSLSSPSSGSSAFTAGGATVMSQGFGGFGTSSSGTGFGGAPSFGSGPQFGSPGGTFGGAPTFGATSPFGGTPTFGGGFPSGSAVFGSNGDSSGFGNSSQAPSFGALAQASPTFGSMAQGGDTPSFGNLGGGGSNFGQIGQSPSFTNYRS